MLVQSFRLLFPVIALSATQAAAATLGSDFTLQQANARDSLLGIVPPQTQPARRQATDWLRRQLAEPGWRIDPQGPVDRYGRQGAHVLSGDRDLARAMVQAGWAMADGSSRDQAEAGRLLAAERQARQDGLGLWAENPPVYDASNALSGLGRYALVEGRVHHVSFRKGSAFLDFGEDWRSDTTAFIPAKLVSRFGGLERLEGRRVRLHGWIESRNGASIALLEPQALESLD